MGAAPSHEEENAGGDGPRPPQRTRPSLGPRPSNVRHLTPSHSDSAALPAALFRDTGRQPRDLRPIEYRPPVQQTQIVRNVVNLYKSSLKLVRAAQDPHVHLVEFEFDAFVDGYITIYYCAKEIIRRRPGTHGPSAPVVQVSYAGKGDELPSKTKFGPGRKQKYRQKVDKGLDSRKFTSAELRYKSDSNLYPVVIRLEASYPPDSTVPEHLRVRSQTTFASVSVTDGVYQIHVIAQQVLVRDSIHRVEDMYGIGAADVTARKDTNAGGGEAYKVDANHECVICLTEPSNTAVLPCNHLCLCDDCARILCTETDFQRRKCPVCRTQLGSLLRIISAPTSTAGEENGSTEAGSQAVRPSSTVGATAASSDSDIPSIGGSARSDDRRQVPNNAPVATDSQGRPQSRSGGEAVASPSSALA